MGPQSFFRNKEVLKKCTLIKKPAKAGFFIDSTKPDYSALGASGAGSTGATGTASWVTS